MILHFPVRSATLDLHPEDDGHRGEMINLWRNCYENAERRFEAGFSSFSGDMAMLPSEGYLGMLVITGGAGTLETDEGTIEFAAGDVLVYEAPVGHQRLRSPGCTYVYLNVWDSLDLRDALRASLAPAVPGEPGTAPGPGAT